MCVCFNVFRYNCNINGYNPRGLIKCAPGNWGASIAGATFIDSTFTTDMREGFYSRDLFSIDSVMYNGEYYDNTGVITFESGVTFTLINNTFYNLDNVHNTTVMLYIDTRANESDSCFFSNTMTNFAIYLRSGIIGSCPYKNISYFTTKDENCWDTSALVRSGSIDWDIYDLSAFYLTNLSQSPSDNNAIIIDGNPEIETTHFILSDTLFKNMYDSENNFDWSPFRVIRGNLSLIDVFISQEEDEEEQNNPISLKFSYNGCDLNCLKVLNWSYSTIHELQISCDEFNTSADIDTTEMFDIEQIIEYFSNGDEYTDDSEFNIFNSSIIEAVTSLSPETLQLSFENYNIYPGGELKLKGITIKDSSGRVVTSYYSNITTNLDITRDDYSSYIFLSQTIDWKYDYNRSDGSYLIDSNVDTVYIQGLTKDDIDETYDITLSIPNNGLKTSELINISITSCPPGFGIDDNENSECILCPNDYFSFETNQDNCYYCNTNDENNAGIECNGGTNVTVKTNNWINLHQEWDMNRTGSIQIMTTTVCPVNYCCPNANGCDYDINDTSNLCAKNRDPNTPLCGKCKDGYSEYFGTSECGNCKNAEWGWITLSIVLTFLFVLYLTYFSHYKYKQLKKIHEKQMQSQHEKLQKLKIQVSQHADRFSSIIMQKRKIKSQSIQSTVQLTEVQTPPGININTTDGTIGTGQDSLLNSGDDHDGDGNDGDGSGSFNSPREESPSHTPSDFAFMTEEITLLSETTRYRDSSFMFEENNESIYHDLNKDSFSEYFDVQKNMIQIMLFRPLTYYLQAISYISAQHNVTIYFNIFLQIFSLSLDVGDSSGSNGSSNNNSEGVDGICIFQGLTGIGEIAFNYFIPLLLIIELLVFKFGFANNNVIIYKRKANMLIATWQVLLLSLGVVLATVFRFLACRGIVTSIDVTDNSIENVKYVLFYAGSETCFTHWLWILHIVFLVLLIGAFVYLFFQLKNSDIDERNHLNFGMRTLIYSFKSNCWYWEFVLVSRRLFIAGLTTFEYINESYFNFLLLIVLCVYLVLHCYYLPFKTFEINVLEGICLFLSIAIFGCFEVISADSNVDVNVIATLISIFILIPILIVAFYPLHIVWVYYQMDKKLTQSKNETTCDDFENETNKT